jgi:hypothetical protein
MLEEKISIVKAVKEGISMRQLASQHRNNTPTYLKTNKYEIIYQTAIKKPDADFNVNIGNISLIISLQETLTLNFIHSLLY